MLELSPGSSTAVGGTVTSAIEMCSKTERNFTNRNYDSNGDQVEPTDPTLEAQSQFQPQHDVESQIDVKRWTGPDCAWSWVIAVACSMLNFFTLALLRSGSVLFLNSIEYYDVSRAAASWPPSLIIAVANLSGIITGYLTKRWGPRRVALIGSVLSSGSIMACFFATDITRLTILCGICHGLGMGLNVPAVAVCLNLWFRERKVTASGIIYTGAALGSFVYPIFFEWLIDVVGFRGAFLVLGALMSHGLAAALFIRHPPWTAVDGSSRPPSRLPSRRPSVAQPATDLNPLKTERKDKDSAISGVPPRPVLRRRPLIARSVSDSSFDSVETSEQAVPEQRAFQRIRPTAQHSQTVEPVLEEADSSETSSVKVLEIGVDEVNRTVQDKVNDEAEYTIHASGVQLHDLECCHQQDDRCPALGLRRPDIARVVGSAANASASNATSGGDSALASTSPGGSVARSSIRSGPRMKLRRSSSAISTTISLYSPVSVPKTAEKDFEVEPAEVTFEQHSTSRMSPLMILVGITYVFVINCNSAFQTILLDFAADKDVEVHESVYLLSGFAVFDIAGRLSVGVISDMGLLSRPSLIGCAALLFGVAMQLLPLASGFIMLLSFSALIGFSLGTSVVLITVLIGDYVADLSQIPLAIGWMAFVSGITGLTRPLIIGYFRDTMGDYDGMLHLMGSLMLGCGMMWIGVTCYEKRREQADTSEKAQPRTETSPTPPAGDIILTTSEGSNADGRRATAEPVESVTRL